MQLCKVRLASGEVRVGCVADQQVRFLGLGGPAGKLTLSDVLHDDDPVKTIHGLLENSVPADPGRDWTYLPPIDRQEVWGAGVTYKRSREARERESEGAARFYDLVYSAERPELFFKASPERVAGPGDRVHIRKDSRWSVPEPELALVISPRLQIVGCTIGNDMSARDIEGENPLYLPQAKVYDHACALGPVITLADQMPALDQVTISLRIERGGQIAFEGATRLTEMARSFDELVRWLGRETSFPEGVVLLTGTGVVPPDDFALAPGDLIHIDITGIGRLTNWVQ